MGDSDTIKAVEKLEQSLDIYQRHHVLLKIHNLKAFRAKYGYSRL